MPTFQLHPTNHHSLEFEGELLLGTSSPKHQTENGWRRYELALYKPSGAGFVVSMDFQTTCPNERCITQAEVVDEPKDVENVLLLFNACEYVDKRSLNEDQRKKLRRELYRIYDEQVTQILDGLTEHGDEWQTKNVPAEDKGEPAPNRGLLGFLRLN